jgi:hypothetical protein
MWENVCKLLAQKRSHRGESLLTFPPSGTVLKSRTLGWVMQGRAGRYPGTWGSLSPFLLPWHVFLGNEEAKTLRLVKSAGELCVIWSCHSFVLSPETRFDLSSFLHTPVPSLNPCYSEKPKKKGKSVPVVLSARWAIKSLRWMYWGIPGGPGLARLDQPWASY